jgi:prepilin-type N-terminal cleavage/methylation domain-containing protein
MFVSTTRRGFSLIELVIVVVIIGIIAAIAIPRMSRGAAGAADGALSANLAVLRNAIDLYQTEHSGTYPTVAGIANQLTGYTNAAGTVGTQGDGVSIYGPYLRAIPPLPVGADKGKTDFVAAYAAGHGWVYDATAGTVKANCAGTETDAAGKAYNAY